MGVRRCGLFKELGVWKVDAAQMLYDEVIEMSRDLVTDSGAGRSAVVVPQAGARQAVAHR